MKEKFVFLLLIAAVVCGGCSKEEDAAATLADGVYEIMACSSVEDLSVSASSEATRTPFGNSDGTGATAAPSTNLEARVLGSNTSATNFAALCSNGTMTFNGATQVAYGATMVGTTNRWFPNTGSVYLCGLYPATGWKDGTGTTDISATLTGSITSFQLTGKDDVMFAPQQTTTATQQYGTTPTFPTLVFTHQLCLLRVKAYKVGNTAIVVKGISVTYANTKVQIALTASPGTISFVSGTANLPFFNLGANTGLSPLTLATTAPAYQGYVLVPPVTGSTSTTDYTLSVTYTIGGGSDIVKAVPIQLYETNGSTAFAATTAGISFGIELKFTGGEIKAKASVKDWTLAGATKVEI
jgi:hypothetical protein